VKVVIACGGTGGHFYPGYALARELKHRGHETLFLVRDGDPAKTILEAEDLPSIEVKLRGLSRRPSTSWLTFLPKTFSAIGCLRKAFRSYNPDVFVGMGAYLTGAAAIAARLRSVPIVLHEANAVLGLANRAVSHIAGGLALGLPLASKIETGTLTGTPIRKELHTRGDKAAARKSLGLDPSLKTILVLGGSQGAAALNTGTPSALAALNEPVQAYHLCGKGKLEETRNAYATAGENIHSLVAEYDSNMAQAYAACDAVICRAGASTAAELLAQRLPAVLIPYPHATADHQTYNARALEAAGIGRLLHESDLNAKTLAEALTTLPKEPVQSPESLIGLPPAAQSAARLADVVEQTSKAVR